MSFRRLVPLVAILAVFTMALRFSIGPDTYWHLRAGDWILSKGSPLMTDPFSLTSLGSKWIYPGWLAQITMISTYRLLGFPGLNLLTALAVAVTFGFVWKTMRGGPLLRAFVLLFAATVSAVYWSARPHIFTFVFTAVTLLALARFRREGSRAVWVIPGLTAVWANVHGGFVISILLLGLEIIANLIDQLLPQLRIAVLKTGRTPGSEGSSSTSAASDETDGGRVVDAEGGASNEADAGRVDEGLAGVPIEADVGRGVTAEGGVGGLDSSAVRDAQRTNLKTLAGVGLASVVAIVLNPFGVEMYAYPFRTISIGVLQDFIQEWQSPNFHQVEVQPFLWLLLAVALSMAISPKRPTSIELIHVGVFAYLGFVAARNIALFALVTAPVLSRHFGAILERWLPRRSGKQELPTRLTRPLNALLLVLIMIAVFLKGALPLSSQFNEETIEESMPARAVEYIRVNQPQGRLLNSYNWGGYVLWKLYPQYLSFVDGRTDLFDDAILEEYLETWRGNAGWQGVLGKWGIHTVLIETDSPLARELLRDGWTAVHKDDQATVFTGPN